MANIPTVALNESSPAGSDLMSTVDNRLREFKVQIREMMGVDHDFPSSGQAADNGQHLKVTLQEQADLGTGAVGATIFGSQTIDGKGEAVYTDEDDNDIQMTIKGTPVAINGCAAKTAPVVADLLLLCDSADSYKSKKLTLANLMNLIYPVGFVVTLGVSTNPNTLFGIGTWTAIAGKVIVGIDGAQTEFDTLNETGGAKTVTLTGAQSGVAAHTHTVRCEAGVYGAVYAAGSADAASGFDYTSGAATPANAAEAHENMPPYIVKYVWQRTA